MALFAIIITRYWLWCCGDLQHARTGYRTGTAVVATKIKNKTTERYTFIEETKGGILVYQSCILVLIRDFPLVQQMYAQFSEQSNQ